VGNEVDFEYPLVVYGSVEILKMEGAMKHKNIALIVLVASLFLLLASHHTVAAAAGTTVKLTLPNLPGGS
jgi:hypothetical protein